MSSSSSCPSFSSSSSFSNVNINITDLLHDKYQHTSRDGDEWDRLLKCWGIGDCGDCGRSRAGCGWCPVSSTCLPLPQDRLSKAFPLLTPIRHKGICALESERFELRTRGLGCQVSTITFLTCIVTIFATIFGLLVIYGLANLIRWAYLALRGSSGGYVLYGDGTGETWVRSESWGKWWRRVAGKQREFEVEEVDEGTNERGWSWWRAAKRSVNGTAGEGRVRLE